MTTKDKGKKNRKSTFDVYVGHLPTYIHEDKINEVFSQYGDIADILCKYNVNGQYGYAIVKFKYQKDVDRILHEVNKVSIDGHEMEVKHGKRSGNSPENGNGSSPTRTVTFLEPKLNAYQVADVICVEPSISVQVQEPNYMCFANNESNCQQLPAMIEVMCTNVEDSVTFYGCPIFRCEDLQKLSLKMNSICPNLIRLLRKPGLRKVYGALYVEDMSWYRCSVIQTTIPSKPGVCIVHYIDYGNIDEVSYNNLVDLPEPIKNVPPFSVKCILSNLNCNPNSHCDITYLHHLVNQRMSLCALTFWGVPEYHVLKCSCNGIDVISELVRNGFAVYKSQKASAKSSPSSRSEKHSGNKSKKSGKSKNSASKNVCNGVGKHTNGVDSHTNHDTIKIPKTSVSDDVHNETLDFVPKKIIKRGSGFGNLQMPYSTENKVKESVNHLLKVDCVISNLKLVNNIRDLVSPTSDDNLINNAVQLLLNGLEVNVSEEAKSKVEDSYNKYTTALNELKACVDQSLLSDLKDRKEVQRNELCNELNVFLANFNSSLLKKRKTVQKVITDLESNSNAWMNVYLPSQPETIEDLLEQYNKEKENRWNIIQKARENTNDKHKKFIEFLDVFQKEFFLNISEEKSDDTSALKNVEGKKGSWALKFEEALSEFGSALDEEMKTCTVYIGKSCVSVIQCILERLDIPKELIDTECELYEKYKSLYDDLNYSTDIKTVFDKLADVQDKIKSIVLQYSECQEIDEKNRNLLDLHIALTDEDVFLESLAKASAQHFPELIMEHPDLNLAEYQKNCYLLKHTWVNDYFPHFADCCRIESSRISRLIAEPVVVKEFQIGDEVERNSLIKKGVIWNEIKSSSLVRVKAFFSKDEQTMCAMISSVWDTFYNNPLSIPIDYKVASQVLQQVLVGLKDIHSRGMAHGAVHPLAILHKDGDILLDFNYDLKCIKDKLCIKGLNFQVPSGEDTCKSADMYGFGCLVLWVLFPNLSFTSTERGVPNLSAFQSIVEEFLSAKDFAALSALLNANPDLRPSSGKLLSSGFLKDLRIIPAMMP